MRWAWCFLFSWKVSNSVAWVWNRHKKQISILHEHLTTKTKIFIACEPKISSASFALARVRFFDGSLRLNFWLFFPYDVLNKNANLIMNLWANFYKWKMIVYKLNANLYLKETIKRCNYALHWHNKIVCGKIYINIVEYCSWWRNSNYWSNSESLCVVRISIRR